MSYSFAGNVKSLKTRVYFIHIRHLHLDLPYFNASRPQGVTGHSNAQCSSGGQQKGIAEGLGPGRIYGECCPAGPRMLETFTREENNFYLIWFQVFCYNSLSCISINMPTGTSQEECAAAQLWNTPSQNGRLHEVTPTPMKKTLHKCSQVWNSCHRHSLSAGKCRTKDTHPRRCGPSAFSSILLFPHFKSLCFPTS